MLHVLLLTTLLAAQDSVPLYKNLGNYHHKISTAVPATQQYFDQGLRLAYGFNHEEAIRSFREAARLDPKCAICWWGVAYAYGPNLNLPMDSAANVAAADAIAKAKALLASASPVERDLVVALEKRYGSSAGPAGDSAYMNALQVLAEKYPREAEVQTLAAESRMLLRPWNYWKRDGSPYPGTAEQVALLEAVVKANPNHPGACHFYIHAVEAATPEKAVPCAERLASLMPGAGHLVHMPAHIYIRVGRWNDAIDANHHAVHADEEFIGGQKAAHGEGGGGLYSLVYYPHNHHFLAFAATMAGRSKLAFEHAEAVQKNIPAQVAAQFMVLQPVWSYPYLVKVTFAQWDAILALPMPPSNLRAVTAMAAYAKGTAHAAKGNLAMAAQYVDTVRAVANELDAKAGNVDPVMDITLHALLGEIAQRQQKWSEAEQHFRAALAVENTLLYNEPPDWYYPVRHSLGGVLLNAGKAAEAEQVYREDLKAYADNVWSLTGLAQALKAQGKDNTAVLARINALKSDVEITGSRH